MPAHSLWAQEPPNDEAPLAPTFVPSNELYRLRVENVIYGSVSLSADGGLHYTLIGRVTRPATAVAVERTASQFGVVVRSGREGLAFAVNLGQTLKLRPAAPVVASGKRNWPAATASEPSAILTNIAPRMGLFGDLVPTVGTQAKLEADGRIQRAFPTLYEPSPQDIFVFIVPKAPKGNTRGNPEENTAGNGAGSGARGSRPSGTEKTLPLVPPEADKSIELKELKDRFVALGQAYTAQSFAHARQERQPFYSGSLTLKAKLPGGEPDPILYVTYAIDNRLVSTQNVAPYDFEWDTRQVADGEHVIEIRALNRNGHTITLKRTLVIVQNKPNQAGQ